MPIVYSNIIDIITRVNQERPVNVEPTRHWSFSRRKPDTEIHGIRSQNLPNVRNKNESLDKRIHKNRLQPDPNLDPNPEYGFRKGKVLS